MADAAPLHCCVSHANGRGFHDPDCIRKPECVTVSAPKARDAIVALTELRGWALGGKGGVLNVDNGWLLERIDKALDGFDVLAEVQRIHGDVGA